MPGETPALPVVARAPPFFPATAYQLLISPLFDAPGNRFRARDAARCYAPRPRPASNFMEVNAL